MFLASLIILATALLSLGMGALLSFWHLKDRALAALAVETFGRAVLEAHVLDEVFRRIEEEDAREVEATWVH